MIEAPLSAPRLQSQVGKPSLELTQRAYLQCGCSVWIGRRADTHKPATFSQACGERHRWLVGRFNDLFKWVSFGDRGGKALINVVDDLLSEAAREMR